MKRVVAQGDLRPMAGEQGSDGGPAGASWPAAPPFYSKADFTLDTSAQPLEATLRGAARAGASTR